MKAQSSSLDFLKDRKWNIIFLLSFLILCFIYEYQRELFVRPHGYHMWRQTDGFCVVRNYYEVSMDFFKPRISQFISDQGLELAEFPIAYYISASGYQIFGFYECIPRLVSLFFVLWGLWCLYRLLADLWSDPFYAVVVSLFLFTSPVLISYSIVPLPDIPGMLLSLVGLYYFYLFYRSDKLAYLFVSFIVYAVAGAIKPTSILSFLSILPVTLIWYISALIKPDVLNGISRRKVLFIFIYTVATLSIVVAWWSYVSYFRAIYHTSYFQTYANPIWKGTPEQLQLTWLEFDKKWLNHYFNKPMFIAVGIILVFALFFTTRRTASFVLSFFIYVIGCAAYILFFFTQFYMHDYYIIVVLPLFIAAIFLILSIIRDRVPSLFISRSFKGMILLIFIVNVCYAGYRSDRRWHDPTNYPTDHLQLVNIEPYLDSIGVHASDRVIYWGDFAPNTGLYLMHRRGWGPWSMWRILSTESVRKYKEKGAKYLIIDQNQIDLSQSERDFIGTLSKSKIGERERVLIFAL